MESYNDETEEPDSDEELDPRIQVVLEKLNSSTDVINKLEIDLEESRTAFRIMLTESGQKLSQLSKQLGNCVDKARPYYEARMKLRLALFEAQKAAVRFEKASSAYEAAKEMVELAQQGYIDQGIEFDQAWKEMLDHSVSKVNETELERNLSAEEHRAKSTTYQNAENRVQDLQKNLKRSIQRSRPYFEMKAKLHQRLDDMKRRVQLIEETIQMTKQGYSDCLRELENISEEIHARRRKRDRLEVRTPGVGAESPPPSPKMVEMSKENDGCSHGEQSSRKESVHVKLQNQENHQSPPVHPLTHPVVSDKLPVTSVSLPQNKRVEESFVSKPKVSPKPLLKGGLNLSAAKLVNDMNAVLASKPKENSSNLEPSKLLTISQKKSELELPNTKTRLTPTTPERRAFTSPKKTCPPVPMRLALPDLQRVKDGQDDESDNESLASMDILDDDQIENLMKEMSLQSINDMS